MIVMQRSELSRTRFLYFLTIILAMTAIVSATMLYSESSGVQRTAAGALGLLGLAALILALLQLYAFPKRSQVLLLHQGDSMIIATNVTHEGHKFRFLRDILTENIVTISDEDRARWKFLEQDGYYATMCIRDPKKTLIVKLCTAIFDDVFAVDRTNRWEHYDSANTADPPYAKNEMPRLRNWSGV